MGPVLSLVVAGAAALTLPAAIAALILLLRLRRRLTEREQQNEASAAALRAGIDSLCARAAASEARLAICETRNEGQVEWLSSRESVHLNKRGQVLRLHQKGSSLPEIAASLRLSQAEVKLMIKVQESLSGHDLAHPDTNKVTAISALAAKRLTAVS